MSIKNSLRALSTPKSYGRLYAPETLALQFTPNHLCTSLGKWTNERLAHIANLPPLVVFPEQRGRLQYIFPDTVVVRVKTELAPLQVSNGKPLARKALDATAISRAIMAVFGVKGDFGGCNEIKDQAGYGYQVFYVSTCNISLDTVHGICQDLVDGKFEYNGSPMEFVRLDTTTNIPAAVRKSQEGSDRLASAPYNWKYRDNWRYVGDFCHTYSIIEGVRETKIYDKFRYMLEVGKVMETLGDNYGNILLSPQANIHRAFTSPLFHQQGFGRVETRYIGELPSLEEILDSHSSYIKLLAEEHCEPTSFKDSFASFLQPGHTHTLVVVEDTHKTEVDWCFSRHANLQTSKVNGWKGTGEKDALRTLKSHTFGDCPVEVFWVRKEGSESSLTHHGTLLPDFMHTGSLVKMSVGNKSRAKLCNSGLKWSDVGLDIPLSLENTLRRERNLVFRNSDARSIEVVSQTSDKALERKAKNLEAMRVKRLAEDKKKAAKEVEANKHLLPPSDYTKYLHISKLADVAKPICTRYHLDSTGKYQNYMVLVGKSWYRANTQLSRMLDTKPALPLAIEVWDTESEYNGNKIWGVNIKPYN